MIITIDKKSAQSLYFLCAAGMLAGFLNGFLGAGGGIVMLYTFKRLNTQKGEAAARDNFATVVAAVLPLCIVSAVSYSQSPSFSGEMFSGLVFPAVAGGALGAYLTDKLNTGLLKNVFAVIVIAAGINMLF